MVQYTFKVYYIPHTYSLNKITNVDYLNKVMFFSMYGTNILILVEILLAKCKGLGRNYYY